MVAPYSVVRNTFVPGSPHVWTQRRLSDTGVLPDFDLAPDGRRVVALVPASGSDDAEAANHVTLMLNFVDQLKLRVP
jgi:hypothetical protein